MFEPSSNSDVPQLFESSISGSVLNRCNQYLVYCATLDLYQSITQSIKMAEQESPISYEQLAELENDFEEVDLEMSRPCSSIYSPQHLH